ncbi:RNA-binding S4 domain-containing protein [Chroococcus sp. FPU101]|uniref:RNA-binding S4 domain-containing protein n=1 Tax=Chroococcus sp. FPU101 TaxID=1974212 RepID=UPI001A90419C|nr:RNA-binding S4 domain-containing protein [Chroococcus sp. FPU101]GFE71618.1 RNA-binding S4 domain-containing protein [Chroococcus sp. FPU101]
MTQDKIITLAQFLKWKGLVQTGGEAKHRIQGGEVLVDDLVETRRGRKLTTGHRVTIDGNTYVVELE